MKERVQKLMSQLGIASRRAAEEMMEHGRIRINGKLAKPGDQIDTEKDTLEVDGRKIKLDAPDKIYIAVYKPKNVVSTNVGHRGDDRQTIRELVPHEGHLFTIGRLDADSEGLVVLTNDGELAQKLSHPRFQHTKTYKVIVQGLPKADAIEKWQRGVMLEEGMTGPASVRVVKGATDFTTLRVVMTEGKKRQIRRVAQLLGHPVKRLVRTRIGMLELGTLKPGEWRELTPKEVSELSTPAPELKAIKQIGSRRNRFGPGRAFDADAKPGRRGRPSRDTELPTERSSSRPRRTPSEDTAPGGYESDRKPMRRGRPAAGQAAGDERRPQRRTSRQDDDAAATGDERRPARRPFRSENETAPGGYESDRKPMRRSRPGAPTSSDEERTPRRSRSTGSSTPSSGGNRRPGSGRPGAKRGRPAPNNPGAVRRPRPAKRRPKNDSES